MDNIYDRRTGKSSREYIKHCLMSPKVTESFQVANSYGHCLGEDVQENHRVRTLSKDLGKMRYSEGEPGRFKRDQFQARVRC